MYIPRKMATGRWSVMFGDELMGYAPTKFAAFRIAAVMNGGDMELVMNDEWEFFLDEKAPPAPPVIVDMLNEPPQL